MTKTRQTIPLAAVTLAIGLLLAAADGARAVDTPSPTTPPDLTAIRAQIKAKEFAAARDALLKLSDTHQHADVYNLLGFALRKTGDYERAYTYYRKALDFEPNHKGAHEYLGELYVETNRIEKAREHLAILEKLCPAGCEEREDLEQAIKEGQSKKKKQ